MQVSAIRTHSRTKRAMFSPLLENLLQTPTTRSVPNNSLPTISNAHRARQQPALQRNGSRQTQRLTS
jgi:hypothetical protein